MYTESKLKEIAKGVFAGSPAMDVLYANPNGTFNNERQFAAKSKAQQEGWIKITREELEEDKAAKLANKKAVAEADAMKKAEAEAAQKAAEEAAAKKAAEAEKKKAEKAAAKSGKAKE